jgi:uncharacterized protein (TIGR02597 family)
MNPIPKFRYNRLLALCATLGLTCLASAQTTTVTTVPVGAMTYSFAANSTASVGIPLLRPAIYSGTVTAGNTATLTLSGTGLNLANSILSSSSYFLEVTGHSDGVTTTNIGVRLEINEITTVANANGVAAIDTLSNLNTSTGNFSALIGYKVCIRPHWTLATLFGTGVGVTGLTSATTFSLADQVLAWDGSGWSTYWFRQNSAGSVKEWRNTSTGTNNQDGAIIPAGAGVYLRKAGLASTISVVGEVRTNRFIRILDNTTQLIALGFPVDISPSQLGLSPASNFTAATTFSSADQVLAWDGTGFSTYWLRRNTAGDIIQWRNTATTTTDHSNTAFIASNKAYFIKPIGIPDDIVAPVPFTL